MLKIFMNRVDLIFETNMLWYNFLNEIWDNIAYAGIRTRKLIR